MNLPRKVTPQDIPELHALICELAEYERIAHLVQSSPADFERVIFQEHLLEGLVVDGTEKDLAGCAIFYRNFSSFTGKSGLWLEDLYVRPKYRGQGIGGTLLRAFLGTAEERGCGRAEWSVLDWNEPAIEFYRSHQAEVLPDWRICRVTF